GVTLSNKLRYAELSLIDNFSCRQYYGLIVVTDSTICADGRGTNGDIATFCAGDMGGPLVLEDSPTAQVGVASWVASVSCERGYPSGYERVAPHAAWIRQLTDL
ncbi:Trypsin-7, partial [Gryllus bimaculatus]